MEGDPTAWIGIDLGTQSVKVSAFDSDGAPLAHATRPLSSVRHGVRHEQSAEEWWTASAACLRQVVSALPAGYPVGGIATCATSGTLVVANRQDGSVTTPAIMYDDRRAADFTEEVNAVGHEIWSRLGYLMQDSWALPAMVWRQRTNPLSSSEIFLTQADVISWRLAGTQVSSDSSHTLKSGFDLDNGCWPEGECEALGIPASGLNPVVEPGTVIGSVDVTAADDTGLPVGTPIVAGMTDGSAAQIAAGAVAPGSWNCVLGTTLVLKGSSPTRQQDPTGAIYCHLAPFGSGWWPGGASNIGARAITEELSGADPHDLHVTPEKLTDTAVCYPLTGTGERFPFVSAAATGFTLGEDAAPTDPQGRFMEIALGVALIERLAFDAVEYAGYAVDGAVSFTGGGSTNTTWNHLRASVLGREVRIPRHSAGSFGMAILARAGVEASSEVDFNQIVNQMATFEYTVTPDFTLQELLHQKYLLLIDELNRREWIGPALAQFARENTR